MNPDEKIKKPHVVLSTCFKFIFASAACLFLSQLSLANTTTDSNTASEIKLSLKTVVQLALQNNHQLKAFEYSVSAGQEDAHIAGGELLPKIAVEENLTRTDIPAYVFSSKLNQQQFTAADLAGAPGTFNNPGYLNNYQTVLSIEQPIFAPGAVIGKDIAERRSQVKNEEFERAREEIVYRVTCEYLKVNTFREIVSNCENSIQDANEHLRISRLHYDANLGLYSDVLRAATAQKQAQQNLISAQKNFQLAKRSLGMVMGTQQSVDVESDFPSVTIKPKEHYTAAAISRKDIKALQKNIEIAQKNVKLAESEFLPLAGLKAGYQLDDQSNVFGSEGDGWFVGLSLKWYGFDGGKREAKRLKAKLELAGIKENMHELENTVAMGVYNAWLSVEEAQKSMELAKAALETSDEGMRLVSKRYESSLSPLIDLLDAQLILDNTRVNLVVQEKDYRTALVTLLFESGTLLSDLELE
jgi:outer membrane protein TolC